MSAFGRYGRPEFFLVAFMLTVFKHEWATHGTCYSTLKPSCLPRGSPRGAEAVLFFQRVVELFKRLPTYEWLAQQGITPSETQTYTLSELTNALKGASGVRCIFSCSIIVLMMELVHSIPRLLPVLAKGSIRSAGISISGVHSSTESSSLLVRGTIHNA
jgi:ribonuclease T2 family protein